WVVPLEEPVLRLGKVRCQRESVNHRHAHHNAIRRARWKSWPQVLLVVLSHLPVDEASRCPKHPSGCNSATDRKRSPRCGRICAPGEKPDILDKLSVDN